MGVTHTVERTTAQAYALARMLTHEHGAFASVERVDGTRARVIVRS